MLFNSFQFMLFFPVVILIYFVIPRKLKSFWLLLSSYYFYMSWNPKHGLLLLFCTLLTYAGANGMQWMQEYPAVSSSSKNKVRKIILVATLVINFSLLIFFKYNNFFYNNFVSFCNHFGISMIKRQFDIILPVGISFFIFQSSGYLIDVYRRDIYAELDFFKYALFVSFFPQLVAGPIERSKNLSTCADSFTNLSSGIFMHSKRKRMCMLPLL